MTEKSLIKLPAPQFYMVLEQSLGKMPTNRPAPNAAFMLHCVSIW